MSLSVSLSVTGSLMSLQSVTLLRLFSLLPAATAVPSDFKPHGVAAAGTHCDDIPPVRNIALAVLVRACGDDSTVRSQADGVRAIGAEGGLVEQCVIYVERKFRGLRFFVLGFFVFRTEFLTLAQRQADILPVGNAVRIQIGQKNISSMRFSLRMVFVLVFVWYIIPCRAVKGQRFEYRHTQILGAQQEAAPK